MRAKREMICEGSLVSYQWENESNLYPDGATGARRLTMMESGHFISVIVELACRAPNDGYICYCAAGAPIPLSISLTAALIVWQIAF